MALHNILCEFAEKLGYSELEQGVCRCFSMRWLEMELLDQEEIRASFQELIKTILIYQNNLESLIQKINL